MAVQLKAGDRFKSAVCDTQVVVVRAPTDPVELEIGGHGALPIDADAPSGATLDPAHSNGTQAGKRYADEEIGIEVLVTKPGAGSLSISGAPLGLKEAKPLPSSD
ncbi:MAG TPA: hypothetical protein VGI86_18160 [Acidimicrobiia bacterium]|jgi:hypothetical protein